MSLPDLRPNASRLRTIHRFGFRVAAVTVLIGLLLPMSNARGQRTALRGGIGRVGQTSASSIPNPGWNRFITFSLGADRFMNQPHPSPVGPNAINLQASNLKPRTAGIRHTTDQIGRPRYFVGGVRPAVPGATQSASTRLRLNAVAEAGDYRTSRLGITTRGNPMVSPALRSGLAFRPRTGRTRTGAASSYAPLLAPVAPEPDPSPVRPIGPDHAPTDVVPVPEATTGASTTFETMLRARRERHARYLRAGWDAFTQDKDNLGALSMFRLAASSAIDGHEAERGRDAASAVARRSRRVDRTVCDS
jgi:hypothetical protein